MSKDFEIQGSTYTYERIRYNNDVYEGQLKNGKKHGTGKYTFDSGSVYEGRFVAWKYRG